jgi:hypothetical protein
MCFLKSAKQAYLEQNEPFFILKTMISGSILSKTSSFLTGQQCTNAPASNTDGFLLRNTCVPSP